MPATQRRIVAVARSGVPTMSARLSIETLEMRRASLFVWGFQQLLQCQDREGFLAVQGWFLRNFPEVPVLPPPAGVELTWSPAGDGDGRVHNPIAPQPVGLLSPLELLLQGGQLRLHLGELLGGLLQLLKGRPGLDDDPGAGPQMPVRERAATLQESLGDVGGRHQSLCA